MKLGRYWLRVENLNVRFSAIDYELLKKSIETFRQNKQLVTKLIINQFYISFCVCSKLIRATRCACCFVELTERAR